MVNHAEIAASVGSLQQHLETHRYICSTQIATAVYLVARQRELVYATANRSLVDASVGMQASVDAVLAQASASLQGLAEDLVVDRLDASRNEATIATLRSAILWVAWPGPLDGCSRPDDGGSVNRRPRSTRSRSAAATAANWRARTNGV